MNNRIQPESLDALSVHHLALKLRDTNIGRQSRHQRRQYQLKADGIDGTPIVDVNNDEEDLDMTEAERRHVRHQ